MDEDQYKARTRARGPMAASRLLLDATKASAASTAPKKAKASACEARLESLFTSIAPEAPPPSRIEAGRSGEASHAARLDDVFGSLNHNLRAPSPPPAPARAPAARRLRKKARGARGAPPPKQGYTLYELGDKVDAGTERAAALSFLDDLRRRKRGDAAVEEDEATVPSKPTFKKRRRPAGGGAAPAAAAEPKRTRPAGVALAHLADDA